MKQIQQMMTVREVAEALGTGERVIQKHASEMGLTENGKTTYLDEKAVTIIKARIERSGRVDLAHVCELPNVSTDLEMMALDAKVSAWKTRKIQELQLQLEQKSQQLAITEPKAAFYDQVADSKDAIDMRSVASVLNIKGLGRNKLFDKLRSLGILDGDNSPYRRFQDAGYFRVIITSYTDKYGEAHINKKTLVYPVGIDYIRKAVSNG